MSAAGNLGNQPRKEKATSLGTVNNGIRSRLSDVALSPTNPKTFGAQPPRHRPLVLADASIDIAGLFPQAAMCRQ